MNPNRRADEAVHDPTDALLAPRTFRSTRPGRWRFLLSARFRSDFSSFRRQGKNHHGSPYEVHQPVPVSQRSRLTETQAVQTEDDFADHHRWQCDRDPVSEPYLQMPRESPEGMPRKDLRRRYLPAAGGKVCMHRLPGKIGESSDGTYPPWLYLEQARA